MNTKFIPVSAPTLAGREKEYVLDCLNSTWISSNGKYIKTFESVFASFCGTQYAVSCCNGTVALHLALLGCGVKPGDEVLVPTLTFVATANAVTYCGATPVFVDSEPETWNMDPSLLEQQITERTKGIIVVHLYGHPADMDPILAVAKKYSLFVIEDSAEAHGAEYRGRKVGSIGNLGTFSFYGNKIVTCGEGGMVVMNDPDLARQVRQRMGQGMEPDQRYWFTMIGYNYRMTNIAAAIGLAQMEQISWHLKRRAEIAESYKSLLQSSPAILLQKEKEWAKHVYWIFTIVLRDEVKIGRDELMAQLERKGIETRPVFYPMHVLPPYRDRCKGLNFPVADRIASRGINLPTWGGLTAEEIEYISHTLLECIK